MVGGHCKALPATAMVAQGPTVPVSTQKWHATSLGLTKWSTVLIEIQGGPHNATMVIAAFWDNACKFTLVPGRITTSRII